VKREKEREREGDKVDARKQEGRRAFRKDIGTNIFQVMNWFHY
jgi:hypothetical protein